MIRLEDVVKDHGDIRAVRGVTFHVKEGEIFGLLGPNGAGKTTIVRILPTLALPTRGVAKVAGFNVATHPKKVKDIIGLAPQEINLDMELTVYENLRIHGMLHRMKDVKSRAKELLKWIELDRLGSQDR